MVKREPAIIIGLIVGAVEALIAIFVVVFGGGMNAPQLGALVAVIGVGATLIGAYTIRGKVTPTSDPRDDEGRRLKAE